MSYGGAVYHDMEGNRKVGYTLIDEETGLYVWPSYNEVFDHQYSLEDVEEHLKNEYQKQGLQF